MKDFIKISDNRIVSTSHIREYVIMEDVHHSGYILIGLFDNGDDVSIGSFRTREEAEDELYKIIGIIYEVSHEPRVLPPAGDRARRRFGIVFGSERADTEEEREVSQTEGMTEYDRR